MSFFNELGKKTTGTTAKLATEAKLKIEIAEKKEKIESLYKELGRKVYENHIREERINISEIINEDCSNIDDLAQQIECARKEILALNNKKMCEKCFAEIETDSVFCSKCGKKQIGEKTVFEKAEEKIDKSDVSSLNKQEKEIVKQELENKEK